MTRRSCLLFSAAVLRAQNWPQWGGPRRDFRVENSVPLKPKWPASGPKIVWKRALGDGYSSPTLDGGVIYTMFRNLNDEVAIALDAGTGKTVWEQSSAVNFRSDAPDMGHGPYATPLVAGDRVFTAGVAGRFDCRSRKDGKLLWNKELWSDLKGTRLVYGYASSPIAFRDLVIVPCGGKGKSLMAFRQSDGTQVWSTHDYGNVYSSPILINVDGLDQLVALMDGWVLGINPHNGDPQWRFPFKASYSIAVASPLWAPGNLLFVSSEYDAGTKVVRLERNGLVIKAVDVWESNRLRLHHGNAVCLDGTLYFTSGGKGSVALLTAVDLATGKIHWQKREISKATFVWADKKLITLDQEGELMLAEPSPQEFKILAKAQLMTSLAWTPPVLVGSRLYLRDRQSLMAVELGA